ncbi:MAG: hypothetical protein HY898_06220 [Deltaproteobacteria bacterium]|nr:hypothetical protein [Deltaproteobacteria bacterium]
MLALALVAVICRCSQPSPPAATVEGVARMLGSSTGTTVGSSDFAWEPSRGWLTDLVLGRRVLFLGSPEPRAPHDLFRASVRVSPEGRPISVVRSVNLTSSPLGDVHPLVLRDHYAAYAMNAAGAVQQVTLLDLDGERPNAERLIDRLMATLTNWQETGATDGLARTDVSMSQPCSVVKLGFEARVMTVAPAGGDDRFGIDLGTGEVVPGPAADRAGATSMQMPHLNKPPIIWAVDTVRAWTGPAPIAWLEEKVFDWKDRLKRLAYFGLGGQREEPVALAAATVPTAPAAPRALGADGMPQEAPWPPAPLQSMWKQPDPEEGKWEPVRHPFLKRTKVHGAKQAAPPYFYTTYVRSDPKRPYSKVLLIAIDSRQLQLGMEGGVEDPKPLTGAHGEGRIPRDPSILSRVVGAFNGAFKTTHGQYGMMVNRRVLLPPKPGGATVLVASDGRAGFGTWPASDAVPPDVVSFRQNLEPLVEDGKVNPSGRTQWGFQLPGTSMLTHRSGLCMTSAGHMIYAWGPEVSAITLGNAMVQAGCIYGVHLDMNPHHTAFAFLDIRDAGRKDWDAKILTPEMETLPERYILWSPKDFFYLMLRNFDPPAIDGVDMDPDDGTQPPPAWAPAFFHSTISEGGVPVKVMGIAPGRARFRVRAGAAAPDSEPSDDLPSTLDAQEARQVLAAVGLGNTAKGHSLGMRVASTTRTPLGSEAILVAGAEGDLQLVAPGAKRSIPVEGDAIELPVLKSAGKLSQAASVRSAMRKRGAICVSSSGHTWIAQATASIDEPLVQALGKLGCDTVASLDRGAHDASIVARAGTPTPPVDRYEQAVLYVFSRAMNQGAYRWGVRPTGPAVAPTP